MVRYKVYWCKTRIGDYRLSEKLYNANFHLEETKIQVNNEMYNHYMALLKENKINPASVKFSIVEAKSLLEATNIIAYSFRWVERSKYDFFAIEIKE